MNRLSFRFGGGFAVQVVVLLGLAWLTGCTSLPKASPDWSERRPTGIESTSWARTVAVLVTAHPGTSGVQLLPYGRDALSARMALADTAERCLDVQYYIWKSDDAGRLLAERLLRAADRGVHVRLLLDDVGGSASDDLLLSLDTHTNVEVRLFNPVANRFFRRVSALVQFQRVNRRMHNKSFTADRTVTILGGRNVGDHYYAAGRRSHFADLDVLAAGPAAGEVADMFDRYWNCASSIPIHALMGRRASPERLAAGRADLAQRVEAIASSPDFQNLAGNEVGAQIRRREPALIWGRTRLFYDQPEKVTFSRRDSATHMLPELRQLVNGAEREVFVISPYFVPGTRGVEFFRALRERGVQVSVLANSLASNDVTPSHAGYAEYRKPLLCAGVNLFELKPSARVLASAQDRRASRAFGSGSSGSGLHAKAFVIDRRTLFVTSFNLDPRSASLNTEMGLVIEIPELAESFLSGLEKSLPENAYRVEFIPGPGPCKECGSLVWISHENDHDVRYTHEPQTSFCRRLLVCCLALLPIESQL